MRNGIGGFGPYTTGFVHKGHCILADFWAFLTMVPVIAAFSLRIAYPMVRELFALFLGFILWTAAWGGGGTLLSGLYTGPENAFVIPEMQAILLVYSVICSVVTGLMMGALCRRRETVLLLAILLVAPYPFLFTNAAEPVPLAFSLPFILAIVPSVLLGAQAWLRVAKRLEE